MHHSGIGFGGRLGRMAVGLVGAALLVVPTGAEAGKRSRKSKYLAMSIAKVGQLRGDHMVLLKDATGTTVVPIVIGVREAQAIHLGLKKIKPSRPLTHNLLVAVLKKLKGRVLALRVVALKKKVFIGRLVLKDARGKTHHIDARPSDLCVLAAMKGLKVHVAHPVVKATGVRMAPKKPTGGGTRI